MKLTKRTALQFCEDLWFWLAEHPEKDKGDYPEWEKNGGSIPNMLHDCPCCEYVVSILGANDIQNPQRDCVHCPLSQFWSQFWADGNCYELSSPYRVWRATSLRSRFGRLIRISCATQIASAAREERLRLERKARLRKEREA